MIVKETKGSTGSAFYIIPEDSDDLFSIRRVVEPGDLVVADTSRAIKQVKEYARPDKGERVKVRISLRVEELSLDNAVDRLRISGTINETDNVLVPKGSHHSFSIQPGDSMTVDKGRRWKVEEKNILKRSEGISNFILVAIDTQEAAVAKVSGTHVKIIPNIYSGRSGKRYSQTASKSTQNLESFFEDTAKTIRSVSYSEEKKFKIIVFGPGETRRRFCNLLVDKFNFESKDIEMVEGVDVAGEDGIFVFLRSPAIKKVMGSSKLAAVSSILDDVMIYVNKGLNKFAMGIQEVSNAAALNAVQNLIVSDSIFTSSNENEVIKLLNKIETQGAKVFAVDSSTDIGLRVSSLGGIVALLRYSLKQE